MKILRVQNFKSHFCRRFYGTQGHQRSATQILSDSEVDTEDNPRKPFRKGALLLMYCSSISKDNSKSFGVKTITKHVLSAMMKAEALTKRNTEDLAFIRFQLAATTDIGSSALGQVICTKLCQIDDLAEKVNQHLPHHIKILGPKPVTGSFSSSQTSDGQTYSYVIPSYAFAPIDTETSENYRISASVLQELSDVLLLLTGKHSYHNFTISAQPFSLYSAVDIADFKCSEPFCLDNIEFVQLSITGDKLLLFQVRKMIGFAVAIMRGLISKFIIHKIWQNRMIDVPKAPSLGLILEQIHYTEYNTYCVKRKDSQDPLIWLPYKDLIEKFRLQHIYPAIVHGEKNNSTMKWLSLLPDYIYDINTEKSKQTPLSFIGVSKQLLENLSVSKNKMKVADEA